MKKFIIVLLIFAAYILFAHGFLGICAELLSFFDFRKNKPFDYENWEKSSRIFRSNAVNCIIMMGFGIYTYLNYKKWWDD